MAGVLVVLVFVDTFLTGFLLRSVREMRAEHELFRDQNKWILKRRDYVRSAKHDDFDGWDEDEVIEAQEVDGE